MSEPPDAGNSFQEAVVIAGMATDLDTLRGAHPVREDIDWIVFDSPVDSTGLLLLNPFHQTVPALQAQVDSKTYLVDLDDRTFEAADLSWGANLPWLRSLVREGQRYAFASAPTNSELVWDASGEPALNLLQPVNQNITGDYEFATSFYGLPVVEATPDGDRRCVSDAVSVSWPGEVDAYTWYQDLDRDGGTNNGWRATALRVPLRSSDGAMLDLEIFGLQVRANTVARIAVFVGDEMVLYRAVDPDDPGNPYGGDHGSIIRVGELAGLLPSGTDEIVIMLGSTIRELDSTPVGCVTPGNDAWDIRRGQVIIMPVYGWAEIDESAITAEATGDGRLRVYVPIGARNQLSGVRVTDQDTNDSTEVIGGGLVWRGEVSDEAVLYLAGNYQSGQAVRLLVEPLGRSDAYVEHQPLRSFQVVVNATTSNGDGPQVVQLSAAVHPNPNGGQGALQVTVGSAGVVAWSVIDMTGREVATGSQRVVPDSGISIPLNLGTVAAGIYAVRVQQGDESITTTFSVVR